MVRSNWLCVFPQGDVIVAVNDVRVKNPTLLEDEIQVLASFPPRVLP
jgi:S1-C subfamily serine protease